MFSRPVIIFSALCALASGGFAGLTVNREGDPQDTIDQLAARVASTEKMLQRHRLEIFQVSSPQPVVDEGQQLHVVLLKSGKTVFVRAPDYYPVDSVVKDAEFLVSNGFTKVRLDDHAWDEAQTWWRGLTWANRGLAERATLARWGSKPQGVSDLVWESRKLVVDYLIEEGVDFQLRRAGTAAGAAAATFFGVLCLLAGFGWLWRAFLARLRELSKAVRGDD